MTTSRPAWAMSAVSSTTTGGLPGPAQTARLPLFMAARTTGVPPVTTSRRMSLWTMSAWADSSVGFATPVNRSAGPPAARMARLRTCIVRLEAPLALGWALKTTALPAATMLMALQMTVLVGLVLGVSEPITP